MSESLGLSTRFYAMSVLMNLRWNDAGKYNPAKPGESRCLIGATASGPRQTVEMSADGKKFSINISDHNLAPLINIVAKKMAVDPDFYKKVNVYVLADKVNKLSNEMPDVFVFTIREESGIEKTMPLHETVAFMNRTLAENGLRVTVWTGF